MTFSIKVEYFLLVGIVLSFVTSNTIGGNGRSKSKLVRQHFHLYRSSRDGFTIDFGDCYGVISLADLLDALRCFGPPGGIGF